MKISRKSATKRGTETNENALGDTSFVPITAKLKEDRRIVAETKDNKKPKKIILK